MHYPHAPIRRLPVGLQRARAAELSAGRKRGRSLGEAISPFVLYTAIALGAIGVWMALPRRRVNPQLLGALVGAAALGLVLLGLGLKAAASETSQLPNIYFYVFSLIALGSCLRVITHQRPVYAALYFILAILASAGLYLILSAEFMAFALIIIYAGAILITYLFVIMLATQAPNEEQLESLSDYDATAREPLLATGVGFTLLAVLTSMLFTGTQSLPDTEAVLAGRNGDEVLADLPARVEEALIDAELIEAGQTIARDDHGQALIDPVARTATFETADGFVDVAWPSDLAAKNVESLAFDFLNRHPGTIEIAGIILLMAMLGAVVLSRRQVEIDEEAKAHQSRHLSVEDPA